MLFWYDKYLVLIFHNSFHLYASCCHMGIMGLRNKYWIWGHQCSKLSVWCSTVSTSSSLFLSKAEGRLLHWGLPDPLASGRQWEVLEEIGGKRVTRWVGFFPHISSCQHAVFHLCPSPGSYWNYQEALCYSYSCLVWILWLCPLAATDLGHFTFPDCFPYILPHLVNSTLLNSFSCLTQASHLFPAGTPTEVPSWRHLLSRQN